MCFKDTHREKNTFCEYGLLGSWYIKSTSRTGIEALNFPENEIVTGETPFFVISLYFVLCILFILTLASDRAVLYGNVAFPNLIVSIKKPYSSFLKKISVFQKIFSNLK